MIISSEQLQYIQIGEKVKRRILCHGPELMLVEFCFAKGGVGEPHKHENHEQVGYVASGSFEITVGGEKKVARQGDCYLAEKNVVHGVVALEENSVLIDTFHPIREDFL